MDEPVLPPPPLARLSSLRLGEDFEKNKEYPYELHSKRLKMHFSVRMHDKPRDKPVQESCRNRLNHFLTSDPVQWTLIILLVMDVIFIMAELMVEELIVPVVTSFGCAPGTVIPPPSAHAPASHSVAFHLMSMAQAAFSTVAEAAPAVISRHFGLLAGGTPSTHQIPAGCEIHLGKYASHEIHMIEEALFIGSITILSIFEFELFLMMFSLGCKFFHHGFYVLDLFVVTVSIMLEISLKYDLFNKTDTFLVIEFLMFVRLWRMARIFHGIGMSVHEMEERKREELEHELEREHEANEDLEKRLWTEEQKEHDLQKRLNGIQKLVEESAHGHHKKKEMISTLRTLVRQGSMTAPTPRNLNVSTSAYGSTGNK